jgi:hypothetical protein
MSFLIDPPLLYGSGRAYGTATRTEPDRAKDALIFASTMAIFWGVSVSLYMDKRWTKPIWWLCRAASGRDWMLNSGVLRLDWRNADTPTHLVSGAIFASYPYWLWRGLRDGRATSGFGAWPHGRRRDPGKGRSADVAHVP